MKNTPTLGLSNLEVSQAEADALKRLQAETAAELDALLDRAFRGQLVPHDPIGESAEIVRNAQNQRKAQKWKGVNVR